MSEAPPISILKDLHKEEVPEGWFTRRELQASWGKSKTRTNDLIQLAVNSGVAEMKFFRIHQENRGNSPIPHYRFKG